MRNPFNIVSSTINDEDATMKTIEFFEKKWLEIFVCNILKVVF